MRSFYEINESFKIAVSAIKENKTRGILTGLWDVYTEDPQRFFEETWPDCPTSLRADPRQAVGDFLASMTDRYALRLWQDRFIPRRWTLM